MSKPDPETFLPLSPTDFQLLLALNGEPLHGYAIMKEVERASGGRVRIEAGSLYRVIARLLGSRLIEEAEKADDRPRPGQPRRSYALTELGRAVARAEARRLRDTLALARAGDLLGGSEGR
jgi:DNA-binding PadR family transcriptional regulator